MHYQIYRTIIELAIYGMLFLCVLYAARRGLRDVMILVAGVIYGVLLEQASLVIYGSYLYAEHLVMVMRVPLYVGCAWAIILYSAILYTEGSTLPKWAQPFLCGLLVLNVDLAVDAIAVRLGLWYWGVGLTTFFYGVPYSNFWGWYWVGCLFYAVNMLLARILPRAAQPYGPVLAVLPSLGLLFANYEALLVPIPIEYHQWMLIGLIASTLALLVILRPRVALHRRDWPVYVVPVLGHAALLILGLITGVIFIPRSLFFVSVALLLITLLVHREIFTPAFWRAEQPAAPVQPAASSITPGEA